VFDKQTMTSFPLQLKHFIDDTLINQINIKTTLSTSLHTSTVIDGVLLLLKTHLFKEAFHKEQ